MTRLLKELAFSFVSLLLLFTILQTGQFFYYFRTNFLYKIFVLISIPVIGLWLVITVRDFLLRRGFIYYAVQKFKTLRIPRAAKYFIVIVFVGNFLAIGLGKQLYPFYDVGMYRWPKTFIVNEKIFYEPKYYYWQQGQYKILELRKEASFFLAEHFGWGYSHDFAYCTAYFHKGEKENFEFLRRAMQERGIDTLWVGVHTVNFETHEVTFDPDICHAIRINQTANLYYGPIYIPDYQIEKCDEH